MALKDKVVIITGGAMGIGRYNARQFASAGAKLAIVDIAPMETVASEVAEKSFGLDDTPGSFMRKGQSGYLLIQLFQSTRPERASRALTLICPRFEVVRLMDFQPYNQFFPQ